jgi:hypothetical protein
MSGSCIASLPSSGDHRTRRRLRIYAASRSARSRVAATADDQLLRRFVLIRHPQAAYRAQRRGSRTAARAGAWAEVQGCSRHCLWCRVTGIRDSSPQDRRHRQHAHADPGRAGQETQGPQCHAVAATVGTAAALVARGQAARCHAATGLAVSAAELSRTYLDPPNQPAVHEAAEAAGTKKRVTPHTLRHSFATHLLGQDVDIRVIQVLLGHSKLDTALYSRVATKTIRAVTSPLEHLRLLMEGEDPGG